MKEFAFVSFYVDSRRTIYTIWLDFKDMPNLVFFVYTCLWRHPSIHPSHIIHHIHHSFSLSIAWTPTSIISIIHFPFLILYPIHCQLHWHPRPTTLSIHHSILSTSVHIYKGKKRNAIIMASARGTCVPSFKGMYMHIDVYYIICSVDFLKDLLRYDWLLL